MVVGEVAESLDLLVIGGGPGGYAAALHGARLGRTVTLIEKEHLGGVCLNVGCIPSKALLEVADAAALPGRVADWGVAATTSIDMAQVQSHLQQIVSDLTGGVAQLLSQAGVQLISGTARFSRPNRVAVEHGDSLSHFEFADVIVATGSRPIDLPDLPVDGQRVVGSAELLFSSKLPENLVLVGGGYIGVELATAFAKLGSHVTIVEAEKQLLTGFDKRVAGLVARGLEKLGVALLLNHRAQKLESEGLLVAGPKGSVALPADKICVVVGRRPNSDTVGLREAGVLINSQGLVDVDAQRRAADHIFVIGDLTEGPALAHKATAEAEVAAEVACGGAEVFDPTVIPMIVFSDPQVLSVGVDPSQAKKQGLESFRFPFAASGRARTMGDTEGFVSMVADDAGTVVGVHAVGSHVAELAGEAVLAIEMAATVEDLARTIHAHPTLGESIMEAALGLAGRPVHVSRVSKNEKS